MTLLVKKGTFTLATTDSGQKNVAHGLGDTPLVLILFVTNGAVDDTWVGNAPLAIGVMTATEQACCGMLEIDGSAASDVGSHQSDTSVLRGLLTAAAIDFDLIPGSTRFDGTNFGVEVSNAPATDKIVHWIVLGGDELTAVNVGNFVTSGASVGSNVDVTIDTGWGQPDLLLFLSSGFSSGAALVVANSGFAQMGVAWAASETERCCMGYFQNGGETSMDTGSYCFASALGQYRDTTSPSLERAYDLASQASWPTDGFRLTQSLVVGTPDSQRIFYLALQGTFNKIVGQSNSPTADGDQDLDAGFVPSFALIQSDSLPTHTGTDNVSTEGHGLGIGAYDGTTQGLVRMQQDDGNANSVAKSISDASAIQRLTSPGNPPANLGVAVASFPSGNTVRLAWTGLTATARGFGWVALGSSDAVAAEEPPRYGYVNHSGLGVFAQADRWVRERSRIFVPRPLVSIPAHRR